MALTIHRTRRTSAPAVAPTVASAVDYTAKIATLEAEVKQLRETVDAILDALYDEFELEIDEHED